MTLQFYQTGFDVTKNGVYEHLETYIQDAWFGNPVLEIEYKHLDPALNQQVKLPISSHQFTKKNIGDYCRAVDEDGTIYYYYVMNASWKGKETLLVTLSLDTLTTFWDEIQSGITDETHITRRYKNRFWCKNGVDPAWPKIDRKEEDFGTVPMYQVSRTNVNPSSSVKKWTLVYMTKYTSDDELKTNPVSCYCFPSSVTSVNTTLAGDVTYEPLSLSSLNHYYMSAGMNSGDSFTITKTDGSTATYTIGSNCACALFYPTSVSTSSGTYSTVLLFRIWPNSIQTSYTDYNCSKVVFTKCKQVWMQSTNYTGIMADAGFDRPFTVAAGESASSLISFNSWYAANKTDPRLVKIRELPYAPFKESYTDNKMDLPSGWKLTGTWLEFTGTTFGSYTLGNTTGRQIYCPTREEITDQDHNIKFETKFYNSAFYGDKLVFDNNTWVAKWEDCNNGKMVTTSLRLNLNYAVSDGMDNGLLFRVNTAFDQDTDFGDFLICDKNTDVPYYTNDYLNYIRFGKSVDEKAAGLNIASSVVSGVGSVASTIASFAFSGATVGSAGGPFGATGGAVAGVIVGLATTAMSVAKTCSTAYDTINSKIDAYTHQASSVNGTSDLSLFRLYGSNKLINFLYQPYPEIKQMLYNYFRLYGYADDEYAIPESTRRWVDYFKCEPAFSGDMLWNDFLDDIKTRMNLGFRVYHYVGYNQEQKYRKAYDLKQTKENWETTLWSWAGNE